RRLRKTAGCALNRDRPYFSHLACLGLGAVRPRDDLEEVLARLLEVHAAAAVVVVDLALLLLHRIGPVVDALLPDAAEDLVELLLADEEGIVLRLGIVVGVAEVERHAEIGRASCRERV